MSIFTCSTCSSNDCPDFDTWHNPEWVNREQYWSHRAQAWMWRKLRATSPARVTKAQVATEGNLTLRDISKAATELDALWDRAMQNWTDEEVAELLGR